MPDAIPRSGPETQASDDSVQDIGAAQPAGATPGPNEQGLTVNLWGTVKMKVYPENRGTYLIEFYQGDRRVWADAPRSQPWLSTRLQDKLVTGLAAALVDCGRSKEFMRQKVGIAFDELGKNLETDDRTRRAMMSPVARSVTDRTERVTVFPAHDGGSYEIILSGKQLTLSSAQMARKTPDGDGAFNHLWLNLFPTEAIDATKNNWKEIRDYWLEIAEVRDVEDATEAEAVIDKLVEYLERVTLVHDAQSMTGPEFAWHDEAKEVVWVHSRQIARFLDDLKRTGWNDGKLSTTLQIAKYTLGKTKALRIGLEAKKDGRQTRCWPFKPGLISFRPAATEFPEVEDCDW